MSGPKHLWSGEWERDSEVAARERAARGGVRAPGENESRPQEARPPQPQPTRAARPQPTRAPQAQPTRAPQPRPAPPLRSGEAPRLRLRPLPPKARGLLLVSAIVAVLAAGAWGLGQLAGPGRSVPQRTFGSAWLGLRLGVLPAGAVVVTGVAHDSPAEQAGIHTGDVITEIEGRPVAAPVDVNEAIGALRAGDTVEIQAIRGTNTLTFGVKLTSRPSGAP